MMRIIRMRNIVTSTTVQQTDRAFTYRHNCLSTSE